MPCPLGAPGDHVAGPDRRRRVSTVLIRTGASPDQGRTVVFQQPVSQDAAGGTTSSPRNAGRARPRKRRLHLRDGRGYCQYPMLCVEVDVGASPVDVAGKPWRAGQVCAVQFGKPEVRVIQQLWNIA